MSGTYGTVKPADINIEKDVEIFYYYRPSLNGNDSEYQEFNVLSADCLQNCTYKDNSNNSIEIPGLFNLKLPVGIFNQKGLYTIYIRPKEIDITIRNIGILYSFPDVRGIVFDKSDLSDFTNSNALVGYRIDYLNNDGKKTGDFTIITSSNLAQAEIFNSTQTYKLNSSSSDANDIFCTVSPSLAPSFYPNNLPNIGESNSRVKLVNTKFNPIMIELELVEHDAETLSYMIEGDQLVDKDNAIITTFNHNNEIYHQSDYGVYKNEYDSALYEFKKKRAKENIDTTQNFNNLE